MAAAGAVELEALKSLVTSNLGLVLGVGFTAFGAYLLLVKSQTKAGLLMIVVAACIPLLTPFMDAIRTNACPAVEMLGGSCGSQHYSDGVPGGAGQTDGSGPMG